MITYLLDDTYPSCISDVIRLARGHFCLALFSGFLHKIYNGLRCVRASWRCANEEIRSWRMKNLLVTAATNYCFQRCSSVYTVQRKEKHYFRVIHTTPVDMTVVTTHEHDKPESRTTCSSLSYSSESHQSLLCPTPDFNVAT